VLRVHEMTNRTPTPALIAEAKEHPNGWVYQIDVEYRSGDYVPPEAIEGAWKVNVKGEIEGEFQPNEHYRPIETSNRALPAYMRRPQANKAGMWISEIDSRCEHLFPEIPEEAFVGYWLIGPDGSITNRFRPSAKYQPDCVKELLKTTR
jgi:hypothetical protein